MNVFTYVNYAAWILSIIIGISLLTDFIKIETSSNKEKIDRKITDGK